MRLRKRGEVLIHNILVAIDGSESTKRILDFALDLAEKFGATLTIVNVSPSLGAMGTFPQEPPVETTSNVAMFAKDMRRIHEETLNKALAHANTTKPNAKVSTLLKEGDPAIEIVNTANEGGFDVIILGHRELSKMKEIVRGSVSDKVVHIALCPVIIVK